jgi:hypothetical protein
MKRVLSFVLFGLAAAFLGGCPIYPSDRDHRVCQNGYCYNCDDGYYNSGCTEWQCNDDVDCPSDYTCNTAHRCISKGTTTAPPSSGTACNGPNDCAPGQVCGTDKTCHTGDCSVWGCSSGYTCKLSGGKLACVSVGSTDGGAPAVECSSDVQCESKGAGSKCLSGVCVAPKDQCLDATQCQNSQQCVQGVCTPSCSSTKPCPNGYSCDTAKGVCTGNPTPCSNDAQCTGGTTCVQQHCVDRCGPNNTCGGGLVCVGGGCMPDQKPQFTCNTEGVQDACANGSICLRHSCYIACGADGGEPTCATADKFNVCKSVTTSSGTYNVCGSSSNLGSDCDPTAGRSCSNGLVCIDGFCR